MKTLQHAALALAVSLAVSAPALAQTPPDVGDILQERQPAPELPREGTGIQIDRPITDSVAPGGPTVVVAGIELIGNSVFDEATLLAELGEYEGQTYDLAGLRELADQLGAFYLAQGYPFARVFLPAQAASDGVIRMEVVEGRYGRVSARSSDERISRGANRLLGTLPSGEVIESTQLERTTLLLEDLPGVITRPIMRPGEQLGTGDLDIEVALDQRFGFEVGADNHGNRYTGYNRGRFNAQINSPFTFGDQLSLRSVYSEEDLWLGSLTYSRPLGTHGMRLSASYAHTSYELARDFADFGFEGEARISSLGLSYPIVRSQRQNLSLSGTYQYKDLIDEQPDTERKESHNIPLSLSFDRRDGFGGGGILFGSVTLTAGDMRLDETLSAADLRDTDGRFTKFNLDIVRLQALPIDQLTLYARYSGQLADSNLDSSENFSLAGPSGVRAYPVGEVSGNEGSLVQLELRYRLGQLSPYAFYDYGRVQADTNRVDGQDNPTTSLGGAGLGVRFDYAGFSLDASAAWRTQGSRPADENESDSQPRFWLSATYAF